MTFNIRKWLDERGMKYQKANEDNIAIKCPYCQKEGKHFTISIIKPIFNCYKCGTTGTYIQLVAKLDNISWSDAQDIVEGGIGFGVYSNKKEKEEISPVEIELPPRSAWTIAAREYIRERGLSDAEVKEYDIYYCNKGYHSGRIVFPVYCNGVPVAVQSRRIGKKGLKYKSDKNSKLKHYLYGYDLSEIYRAEFQLQRTFIVEGVFDVFALRRSGFNAYGIFGSTISDYQIDWLMKKNPKWIILCLDPDKIDDLEKTWLKLSSNVKTSILPLYEKDPGSMTSSEIDSLLESGYPSSPASFALDKVQNYVKSLGKAI